MRDMMYKYTSLTQVDRCAILKKEPKGSRQEGKDGVWLLPSSQKGVIIMTDFECPGPESADNGKVWYNRTNTEGGRRDGTQE